MIGLKKASETVETAAGKVTASAEILAKSLGFAIGVATVALIVALIAIFKLPGAAT